MLCPGKTQNRIKEFIRHYKQLHTRFGMLLNNYQMKIISATGYREQIISLLSEEQLPPDDLPQTFENFLIATKNTEICGVAGLEIYGNYGLLRSLAVKPNYRGSGVASKLVEQLEALANLKGLNAIYLLTETAPEYFARKGYEKISRNDVPPEIQQSTEFSHVCPQWAIIMKKEFSK